MAGIPTAPVQEAGQRLRVCLKHRPHEFVSTALRELQSAFGKPSRSSRGRSVERKGGAGEEDCARSIVEDIMYFWMLAEAYVQHPALQADMRYIVSQSPSSCCQENRVAKTSCCQDALLGDS